MKLNGKLRSLLHRIYPPSPKPLILMYHRIARDPIDVWDLAVSPEHFEEQLAVLRRTRRPLSLQDFVRRLVSGTLPPDAVAVTFDDGYVDNLTAGKPRLSAADVPATVFLATGYLDKPGEFWWDELSRLVLAGDSPRTFEFAAGAKALHVDLGASAAARADGSIPTTTLRLRQAALISIWETLQCLDDDERQSAMAKIRSVLTDNRNVDRSRAMTRSEVQTLVTDGLVTIGAHTVTHPLLPALGAEARQDEITRSKSDCESLLGTEISGFAYPYGGFDDNARKAVSVAGFGFACTTRHATVGRESDLLALPRIQVRNWDGDTFQRVIHDASADAASNNARAASARRHEIA